MYGTTKNNFQLKFAQKLLKYAKKSFTVVRCKKSSHSIPSSQFWVSNSWSKNNSFNLISRALQLTCIHQLKWIVAYNISISLGDSTRLLQCLTFLFMSNVQCFNIHISFEVEMVQCRNDMYAFQAHLLYNWSLFRFSLFPRMCAVLFWLLNVHWVLVTMSLRSFGSYLSHFSNYSLTHCSLKIIILPLHCFHACI